MRLHETHGEPRLGIGYCSIIAVSYSYFHNADSSFSPLARVALKLPDQIYSLGTLFRRKRSLTIPFAGSETSTQNITELSEDRNKTAGSLVRATRPRGTANTGRK